MKNLFLQAVLFFLNIAVVFSADSLNQKKGETPTDYLARLQKIGDAGNADAFQEIGKVYHDGILVSQNFSAAFNWYKKSADEGSRKGLFSVGYSYQKGEGVSQNYEIARAFYIESAGKGSAAAAYNMALFYEEGVGVEKNIEEANSWLDKAYKIGDLDDTVSVGKFFLLFRKNTPYEARGLKILEDAATNHDHTEAQRFLGTSYYLLDRTYNAEKAFYWLQKAAAKGNATAIVYLGKMYYRGDNPPKVDLEKAQALFQKAADMGNSEGLCNLGALYLDRGKDQPDMLLKGVQNLEKAAQQGDALAQYLLGRLYLKGTHGVAQNYAQAASYFQKSAEGDNADAQYELACLYYEGQGVPENGQLMVKWLKASAAQGNAAARELLDDLTQVAKARTALGASVLDTAPAPAATPTSVAVPAATAPAP